MEMFVDIGTKVSGAGGGRQTTRRVIVEMLALDGRPFSMIKGIGDSPKYLSLVHAPCLHHTEQNHDAIIVQSGQGPCEDRIVPWSWVNFALHV